MLLDKKEAWACYSRSLHVRATLYVSSVKSNLMAYEGLNAIIIQKTQAI